MRAHASPAATRSLRLSSCSCASFFSSAIFGLDVGARSSLPARAPWRARPSARRARAGAGAWSRALASPRSIEQICLPGLDRRLEIAELRLAEPGDLDGAAALRVSLDSVRRARTACRARRVARRTGASAAGSSSTHESASGCAGSIVEHFAVLGEGLRLSVPSRPGSVASWSARRSPDRLRTQRLCDVSVARRRNARPPERVPGQAAAAARGARRESRLRSAPRLPPARLGAMQPFGFACRYSDQRPGELRGASELARVVGGELHRAVVPGHDVERRHASTQTVLAVVRLGERDEEIAGFLSLGWRDRLAGLDAFENRRPELLRERRIVLRERPRLAQHARRAGPVAGELADVGLVAVERELAFAVRRRSPAPSRRVAGRPTTARLVCRARAARRPRRRSSDRARSRA